MSMMPVKNNWKKAIRIGRDVIKPGQVLPIDEVLLYTPRVQRLRDVEKLIFPFRMTETVGELVEPEVVKDALVEPESKPGEDDLMTLVHVGAGRLKILNQFGIFMFSHVIEHAGDLHEILEITKEQAGEIVEDAKSRI